MALILQANLQRSRLAQDLLFQQAYEEKADLVIISEPYSTTMGDHWYADSTGTAAVWIRNSSKLPVINTGKGGGYVWVTTPDITYIGCYLSPNEGIEAFRRKVENLEEAARDIPGEVIVAGDFNAKSSVWGMTWTDSRGREVTEMAARLDLVFLNEGTTSTFRRSGCRGTIIDLTMATTRVASRVRDWRVHECYTASDHQHIGFVIEEPDHRIRKIESNLKTGWRVSKLDTAALRAVLAKSTIREPPGPTPTRETSEAIVNDTMKLIHKGCNAAMPKYKCGYQRKPAYWWTEDIAELRRRCLRARREHLRARRRGNDGDLTGENYKTAKKTLVRAIKVSKVQSWKRLCEEVNENTWGRGYQIVMKRMGRTTQQGPTDPVIMEDIVNGLFPDHPTRHHSEIPVKGLVPNFTVAELMEAVGSMSGRKAPGPDGIPTEVVKATASSYPHLLLYMYNTCIQSGVFSACWKRQRLVLLDKGKGPPITPSSFRPLCMLDTVGKLFEKLLRKRLRTAIEEVGGLACNQFGFRVGRSTVDAIREVIQASEQAWSGNHRTRSACILVTLDVKNAFNSVRWVDIIGTLEERFRVPAYLRRIISDYLDNRELIYETTEGLKTKKITSGVAQGSVLGPDLWNIVYDGILTLETPDNTKLVGFADDLAAIVIARTEEQARMRVRRVTQLVGDWLDQHGLHLAARKTEMVVLTRQRSIPRNLRARVAEEPVEATTAIRYLGVMIDSKLTFWSQIRAASDRAAKVTAALSRLMPNIDGPSQCKRRAMMSVVHSILLYGAEIWADALKMETYRRRMASVQRQSALRITSGYRTVSEAAILVVAGVIPIDLLAQERRRTYLRKLQAQESVSNIRTEERSHTIQVWERRWAQATEGRWTARLVGGIAPWINRDHGEVNFYLTQFLTGHGMFYSYLYKCRRKSSPYCIYCPSEVDSAEHTFFSCHRWTAARRTLQRELGVVLEPDTIVARMLQSQTCWNSTARYIQGILQDKKADEQRMARVDP